MQKLNKSELNEILNPEDKCTMFRLLVQLMLMQLLLKSGLNNKLNPPDGVQN